MQHYDTIEVAKKKSIVTPLISTVTAVSCIQFDPRGHLTNMDTFFRHIGLPIRGVPLYVSGLHYSPTHCESMRLTRYNACISGACVCVYLVPLSEWLAGLWSIALRWWLRLIRPGGEIEAEVGERERGRTDIQLVENVLHYYSIGLFNIFERCVWIYILLDSLTYLKGAYEFLFYWTL